jgi:3-hydroxymyristoyl/3-hydroxydecanoyl-(acyl carrier protein) dehydratase
MAQLTRPPVTAQPASHDPGQPTMPGVDMIRVKYGACLVGAAFILLAVVFAIAVYRFTSAADVAAVVASVATVVGTIIGAFFGIQVGTAGKEAAEAQRNKAEKVTRAALTKLNPADAEDVLKTL